MTREGALPIREIGLALVVAVVLAPVAAHGTCTSGDFAGCSARCDTGDGEACSNLGTMYRLGGRGVARDEARAVELYRKACNLGSTTGCTRLREMYSEGRGVKGKQTK